MAFYNAKAWRSTRASYISRYPLCAVSMDMGHVRGGEIVDHIIPINQGGAPYNDANLMTLTKQIHDTKSSYEAHRATICAFKPGDGGLAPIDREDAIRFLKSKL